MPADDGAAKMKINVWIVSDFIVFGDVRNNGVGLGLGAGGYEHIVDVCGGHGSGFLNVLNVDAPV